MAAVVRRLRAITDPTLTSYRGETQMVELPEEGEKR